MTDARILRKTYKGFPIRKGVRQGVTISWNYLQPVWKGCLRTLIGEGQGYECMGNHWVLYEYIYSRDICRCSRVPTWEPPLKLTAFFSHLAWLATCLWVAPDHKGNNWSRIFFSSRCMKPLKIRLWQPQTAFQLIREPLQVNMGPFLVDFDAMLIEARFSPIDSNARFPSSIY